MSDNFEAFKKKLDDQHDWPTDYLFKFIVPKSRETEVCDFLPKQKIKIKESKKGNYVSVSVMFEMNSREVVMCIYEKAHKIEGLIAL